MKKLLLALLLIPSLCFGEDVQLARLSPAMVGGGVPVAGCTGTVGDEVHDDIASAEDYIICGRFQNTSGCSLTSVTKITAYIHGDTSTTAAKVAVYADSAGSVGSLLYESAEFNPSGYATGWSEFTSLSGSGSIANNAYCWICFWADGGLGSFYYGRTVSGGTHAYRSYDYSTNTGTWPANGSTFNTDGANVIELHIDGGG